MKLVQNPFLKIKESEARSLLGKECVLVHHGKEYPAKIVSNGDGFAKVVSLDNTLEGVWNWDAVKRVMERSGKFSL